MSHFPICYQHDSMQCGIACLQMICRYFGKEFSLDSLSKLCFATAEGVSMFAIKEAACQLGLKSVCAKVSIDNLGQIPLPAIIHWNQNHFVVLYKIKNEQKFYIADPGKGLTSFDLNEFQKSWIGTETQDVNKGIIMMFETTPKFFEQKDNKNLARKEVHSFHFLFGYFKKYHKYFGLIILGLVLGSLIQLVLPFLTQSIVDKGIKNKDLNFIWLVLIGQLMLTISSTIVDFFRRWILLRVSMKINISLISDFFVKLLKLPMSFFDTKLLGDLMQRMNDHGRVNSFLTQNALNIIFSLFTFIVFSSVLIYYDALIFFIFLLGSLLYGGWMTIFLRKRKVIDYELFEQQAISNNRTYEFLTSMQEIKLQDCEQRKRMEWEHIQKDVFHIQQKSLRLQQKEDAGCIFINEMKNIIITVSAAAAVIHGSMTLGMMLAVQYIIGQLNSPVEQLMKFLYSIQDVKISLERINEIHLMDDENGGDNLLTYLKDERKGIDISHVMFKYDPYALKKIIDNMNIHIPYGKVTAIVGASGSGKSTLIRLMLGYYPVLKGKICIGGTDINKLNKKWWRRQCGTVMQDGVIFSESIGRNIAVGDGDVDVKRLIKAAEIACIKDYVMSLPLKFDTKIGRDGVGLSQGQKQRILIARAVYKNPDYIFLDEATNSLDANNERQIVENLNKFYQGKTVIVVAHRLSTVKNADQIIVIDHGKIVEIGNHDSLISSQGAYYHLVKNQLELGCQ